MKMTNLLAAVGVAAMLATGCAQQRGPANEALDKIEASLKDVRDDAAKYAPEGLKGVESQFDRLKKSYEAKEYSDVLAGTPSLQKAVDSLKAAVNSGRESAKAAVAAAKTEWEGLNVEVPKMVDSIQARVDELSKRKILPLGISKDEFAGAKSVFDSMKTTWNDASDEAKKGDAVEAATKGKTAKGMGQALYDQLRIKKA